MDCHVSFFYDKSSPFTMCSIMYIYSYITESWCVITQILDEPWMIDCGSRLVDG